MWGPDRHQAVCGTGRSVPRRAPPRQASERQAWPWPRARVQAL